MKLQFCGAARTVTGSCHYLDTGKYKILVDCGAFQGSDELEKRNYEEFPFDPAELDIVLLTHAHFDHCGRLPKLVRQGFNGRIICTFPTRELTEIVLYDAAYLQKEEYKRWVESSQNRKYDPTAQNTGVDAEEDQQQEVIDMWGGKASEQGASYEKHEPLYDEQDVADTIKLMEGYPIGNSIGLGDGLEIRMRDSGHILGSVIFEVWADNEVGRKRKIVFSGDLGQPGQRIVRDPDMIRDADYVVIESTYGNRLHKSKDETVLEFLSVLKKSQEEGGNVLIPTFAIERAQEVLYELNLFIENKLLDPVEVFLDSPMAIKATEVFENHPSFYDEDARRLIEKGDNPFMFDGLQMTEETEESKRLIAKKKSVIMAGSGMATGGRIIHHLANNIENSNTHVVFVGYQVQGTLGRRIVDMEPEVWIKGKKVDVKAQVHTLNGFSAHGDVRDLRYWLRGFGRSPRMVYIVHGEETVAEGFATNIREELKLNTYVPQHEEVVELE